MRYFIVRYIKTPRGQMDEIVSVSKKLKTKDIQTAAVVLDFKTQQVVLSSLNGVTVPKDWWRIRDFYHRYHRQTIEDLEAFHGLKIVEEPDPTLDKEPESS